MQGAKNAAICSMGFYGVETVSFKYFITLGNTRKEEIVEQNSNMLS